MLANILALILLISLSIGMFYLVYRHDRKEYEEYREYIEDYMKRRREGKE